MPKKNVTKGKAVRSHKQKRAIQNSDAKLSRAHGNRRSLLALLFKPTGKKGRKK